jgi:hypothetical protein
VFDWSNTWIFGLLALNARTAAPRRAPPLDAASYSWACACGAGAGRGGRQAVGRVVQVVAGAPRLPGVPARPLCSQIPQKLHTATRSPKPKQAPPQGAAAAAAPPAEAEAEASSARAQPSVFRSLPKQRAARRAGPCRQTANSKCCRLLQAGRQAVCHLSYVSPAIALGQHQHLDLTDQIAPTPACQGVSVATGRPG